MMKQKHHDDEKTSRGEKKQNDQRRVKPDE